MLVLQEVPEQQHACVIFSGLRHIHNNKQQSVCASNPGISRVVYTTVCCCTYWHLTIFTQGASIIYFFTRFSPCPRCFLELTGILLQY